ncbi:SpoIIE family protein phosphatase [Nocardioides sp. SYSU DS0663]|uniref:SpoIIE family protein phosphatase n=1 Tax=Nocardioides sp. SYSU DS0663 TaxID=3416445 RepID=UPI003F4CAB3F
MTSATGAPHGADSVGASPGDRAEAARRLAHASDRSRSLDRLCELAAALLDTPSAQVSLISDVQVVVGGYGTGPAEPQGLSAPTPAEDSLCTVTVGLGRPLAVSDAPHDAQVAHLPPVTSGAVGAYLGVPLVTGTGHVVGALCAYDGSPRSWSDRDVTTLERLAESVVADLELAALSFDFETGQVAWRLATDAAGVGAFDWDLRTGLLRWDDRLLELFGLDRGSFDGRIETFNATVHPEDLPRVTAALASAIAACGEFATEYRIQLPDGRLRWIAARGRALRGDGGVAVRFLGAAYDTTAVQEGEARVARVLESMPTAFFQLDRDWRFSYLNGEAERLLGKAREELVGQVVWEAFPASVGTDFETYYRRAVETGEPVAFDAHYPAPLDAWYEVRGWPNPDGLAVYFVEVTSRHRAQEQVARAARRDALLAHVTERLSGTLDLGEAVARLGALVVPQLGDWCVATLVTDVGHDGRPPTLRDVGGWHRDPDLQPLVERFADIRLAHLLDTSFLAGILASDQPIVVEDVAEAFARLFEEGEVRDLVRRLAPEHAVVVTLRGRDRVVGLLTVLRAPGTGAFSADDVDTLTQVATRAGLALDNARLFAEHRDLAEGLQRSMLTAPPQPDHLQIAVRYEAAAETAQVGGDWYDAFLQDEGATVVVIGDVVGHDTAAAAAMGQVRSMLRGIAVFTGHGPADVLHGVDRALDTLQVDTTATAVVARLEQTTEEKDRGVTRLRWSNAGHPPPVLVRADGRVEILASDEPNVLLGLEPGAERSEHELVVERGATFLLFTDGLVERRGEDLDTGLERLRMELTQLAAADLPLDRLCDRLLGRMVPSRRDDDIALVAVRLHPQDGPRPEEAGPTRVPASVDPASPGASSRVVRARFAADAVSVPVARAFIRDALQSHPPTLVENAALCVTELAANAALHSGGHALEVSVRLDPEGVTVAVADEGDVPAEAVVPRMVVDSTGGLAEEATTGRGLGIVSVLAAEWGVERTPDGKRVWAWVVDEPAEHPVRPPDSPPSPSPALHGPDDLPDGWGAVQVVGCPVSLALASDQHFDELVRELQLLAAAREDGGPCELVVELQQLMARPAPARHLARLTAQRAAAAGQEEVDLELVLPRAAAEDVRRLVDALVLADRLCEEQHLLTLCATEGVRLYRAWMAQQVAGQLLDGQAPEAWSVWVSRTSPDAAVRPAQEAGDSSA